MFWNEVVSLFTEMNVVPAILLTLGLVLCVIEMFVPGFGVFGISGIVCLVGGIVAKMLYGGTLTQLCALIVIFAVILLIMFGVTVWSAKRGLISHTPMVLKETALPENYADIDESLQKLKGKEGVTVSICRPFGMIQVGDKFYDASSVDEYLEKGTLVKIVEIDGDRIFIQKI